MVRAAAAANGVFLQVAQAGRRLPCVEDDAVGARRGLYITRCQGGDAGEALDEVERRALPREDRLCRPRNGRDDCSRGDVIPFGRVRLEGDPLVERREDACRHR